MQPKEARKIEFKCRKLFAILSELINTQIKSKHDFKAQT